MKIIYLLTGIFLFLSACKSFEARNKEKPLARVNDRNLYPSDVRNIFPQGLSENDSLIILRNYLDKWVKKQLILQKAELNLTEDQKDVHMQIEEYRSSLLIYKYEQSLILQKLDTLITEEEIENYYNEYSSNFILDENIVKTLFIKLPIDAPNLNRIRQLYRSEKEEDFQQLESYCYQFAVKYDYFGDSWIAFKEITDELPEKIPNPERFLKYNKFIEQEDSAYRYLTSIRDYKLSSTISPLDYVQNNIASIIMNKRKVQFIVNMENNIYKDALNKGEFIIY